MPTRRQGSLTDYNAKRDFAITPEPRGRRATRSTAATFCVQKHLARSLHYDLRLEHNGVLLSWAVPKGPSLDPRDKRFAARTEDHPLEYAEFEGVIPAGYGAGIVMLWDRGTWKIDTGDVDAAMEKGELKFSLDGVKLKGSWALIRTRGTSTDKERWLLIKHKDHWAGEVEITSLAALSVKSFGDFPDILRTAGVPPAWRKLLPIQSGESAAALREIIASADRPARSGRASRSGRVAKSAAAKKLPAGALRFGKNKPKLTNLAKPLYPAGFTKGQLIDYYTRIAPLILPHLAGRAVTLKRFPDGVAGKAFFHKRCPEHRPEWVKTVRVANTDDETIDYTAIADISTLVWVANLAAIELHVPLALAATPDRPTAIVFDLDPGEPATLAECIGVARRIAELLKQLKLQSFAKFSGKKGVHLLVPLNTKDVTFDQSRHFAKAVAQLLSRDDPKHVTSVMRKESRAGKVFIDWNQNDRSRTMVSAYSLRAEPAPNISWPLDLESGFEKVPTADDIRGPVSDPLAGVLTVVQSLPKLD